MGATDETSSLVESLSSIVELSDITFIPETNEARSEFVTDQLRAYNRACLADTGIRDDAAGTAAPLEIYAIADDGSVVGGVIGRTHAIREWLEVTILWVREDSRGHGVGTRLMREAEEEAVRRGCWYARLATSHFQAPAFYERLGYALYGRLENCPPGVTNFYFSKALPAPA